MKGVLPLANVCGSVLSILLEPSMDWKFRKCGPTINWPLAGLMGDDRQYITEK